MLVSLYALNRMFIFDFLRCNINNINILNTASSLGCKCWFHFLECVAYLLFQHDYQQRKIKISNKVKNKEVILNEN